MTAPVDVCNLALGEAGNQVMISSLSPPDNSPAGKTAALFYTPKIRMLMRAAPWDSLRAQVALTLLKASVVNGAVSSNPPPQPWGFEYAWPVDCVRLRFLQPTLNTAPAGTPLTTAPSVSLPMPAVPTGIPFVVATDYDSNGAPIKVILTNVDVAQAIYTRDLSNYPDLWDPLFLGGATAFLASYFCQALTRNGAQLATQIGMAKSAIDQARAMNASESISIQDHVPDWMRVRQTSCVPWAWNSSGPAGVFNAGWDQCQMADGLWY